MTTTCFNIKDIENASRQITASFRNANNEIVDDINVEKCKCPTALIVDDHEFNVMSLTKVLKNAVKIECDVCFNGE